MLKSAVTRKAPQKLRSGDVDSEDEAAMGLKVPILRFGQVCHRVNRDLVQVEGSVNIPEITA